MPTVCICVCLPPITCHRQSSITNLSKFLSSLSGRIEWPHFFLKWWTNLHVQAVKTEMLTLSHVPDFAFTCKLPNTNTLTCRTPPSCTSCQSHFVLYQQIQGISTYCTTMFWAEEIHSGTFYHYTTALSRKQSREGRDMHMTVLSQRVLRIIREKVPLVHSTSVSLC